MAITPKASWPWVRTLLHSVFDQPDAESDRRPSSPDDRIIDALSDKLPKVAEHLRRHPHRPAGLHRVPQTDRAPNLVEQPPIRLNKEIRRRTDVVGIFPDRNARSASSAPLWPNNTEAPYEPNVSAHFPTRSNGNPQVNGLTSGAHQKCAQVRFEPP